MSSDDDQLQDVKDELKWDPRVDPAAVAVSTHEGHVTLRGTVGSLREKRAAGKAAENVFGVVAIDNELEVRLLSEHKREDAELRADVLQALMLNGAVPATVDVKVEDGLVTLTGTANWHYQREEAEVVAESVVGTLDVVNEIALLHAPSPDAAEVKDEIARAFRRNASLDVDHLRISTSDGKVIIKGSVRSWAEHDDAIAAAWAAPGVVEVEDRITVGY
jgi:osmotically-inducible protein OsmY